MSHVKIKVIGVGGGNAINHMINVDFFIVANTDNHYINEESINDRNILVL